MRTKKKKPEILWISDIHFIDPKKDGVWHDVVIKYIKCLLSNILLHEYTHIVITGDISFSSQPEEYQTFYDLLLYELTGGLPELRIIIVPGNHDINRNTINKSKISKEKYKSLSQLPYSQRKLKVDGCYKNGKLIENKELTKINQNYRTFFKDYISPSINHLVSTGKLEQWHYIESQGLFGVVYDKEYNLIFNCLNSSWFAFGEDNMIGLNLNDLKRRLNAGDFEYSTEYLKQFLNIKEYGKLVFGSLQNQIVTLENLSSRGRIQECFVVSLAHHPFSWMDYEILYSHTTNQSNFDRILGFSDIFLCGHQHIRHYAPSRYRNTISILESPELMDFKMYILDADDFKKQNKRFGFNILTLNHEKSSMIINQYYTKDIDYYENENYPFENQIEEITIDYKTDLTIAKSSRIVSRKSLLDYFTSLSEMNEYLQKNYSIEFHENNLVKISRENYKSFLKKLIENKQFEFEWNDTIGITSAEECICTIVDIDPFNYQALFNTFYLEIKNLIDKLIPQIKFDSLKNYYEIKILFFDFWVFGMFSKGENLINDRNYQQSIELLENFIVKLKYKLFSNANDYKNIALTFDVINFETYKQDLVQK